MSRGIQRERDRVNHLREKGWWAIRAPASKGDVDVVAIRATTIEVHHPCSLIVPEVRFEECKSTAAGPYAGFGPADRQELLNAANMAAAKPYLYWHPPRREPRVIPSWDWP